jgi:hypothetical protein
MAKTKKIKVTSIVEQKVLTNVVFLEPSEKIFQYLTEKWETTPSLKHLFEHGEIVHIKTLQEFKEYGMIGTLIIGENITPDLQDIMDKCDSAASYRTYEFQN